MAQDRADQDGGGATRKRRWKTWLKRVGVVLGGGLVTLIILPMFHLPRENPAYPATSEEVQADLERMRKDPVGLERPVLVLSGYRSPSGAAKLLAGRIRSLTGCDADMVAVMSYPLASDIDPLGARVVEFVESTWPTEDGAGGATDRLTREVDVVAISMGGIVARVAALPPERRGSPADGRRLNIGTLYTLASPHEGARLSQYIRVDQASRKMRPGSEFMERLNAALEDADYQIVPYAILHDRLVGATRAAPPGQEPIWVPGRIILGHHLVSLEDRIAADLARRLRGEEPLGRPGKAPID